MYIYIYLKARDILADLKMFRHPGFTCIKLFLALAKGTAR